MKRLITLSLSTLLFIHALAQNETYSICEHRINSENVSYTEAKSAWLSVDNARERFDPVCTLDLLSQSLEHGIEHSLENDANDFKQKWSQIFPIWERQFMEGYFDTSLLKTFDLTSENFTGKQYFGTLLNVPCEDEEGLEARKVKFGLLN